MVSALIFALMHGVQNPALFLNRLGFGLLAGVLVWRTGGLEAGIGAHVVNNICAYVIAGLTSSIAAVRAIASPIGWLDSGIQLGGFAVFAGARPAHGPGRVMARCRNQVGVSLRSLTAAACCPRSRCRRRASTLKRRGGVGALVWREREGDLLALLPVPGDGRDSSEQSDDGVWGNWQPG